LPPDKLGDLLKSFANDTLALKEQIAEICYFMKGGIEFNSAWGMSYEDREITIGVINKRLKEAAPAGKEYM
jgi:hypothetical protein